MLLLQKAKTLVADSVLARQKIFTHILNYIQLYF